MCKLFIRSFNFYFLRSRSVYSESDQNHVFLYTFERGFFFINVFNKIQFFYNDNDDISFFFTLFYGIKYTLTDTLFFCDLFFNLADIDVVQAKIYGNRKFSSYSQTFTPKRYFHKRHMSRENECFWIFFFHTHIVF